MAPQSKSGKGPQNKMAKAMAAKSKAQQAKVKDRKSDTQKESQGLPRRRSNRKRVSQRCPAVWGLLGAASLLL